MPASRPVTPLLPALASQTATEPYPAFPTAAGRLTGPGKLMCPQGQPRPHPDLSSTPPVPGSTLAGYMEYTPKYHLVNWPAVATMPPMMRTVDRGEAG